MYGVYLGNHRTIAIIVAVKQDKLPASVRIGFRDGTPMTAGELQRRLSGRAVVRRRQGRVDSLPVRPDQAAGQRLYGQSPRCQHSCRSA
jgi:hypothetical protein